MTTQASNRSVTSLCEESALKELPLARVWRPHEVNQYSAFGGQVETVARDPINEGRQNMQGTVVGVTCSASYEVDFCRSNINRELQGFFYADAADKPCTMPVSAAWDGSEDVLITSVTGTEFVAAAGLDVFEANDLIFGEKFGTANDGLRLVTGASATGVEAAGLVAQASVPADARLTCVGRQFASGDVSVTFASNILSIASVSNAFASIELLPGEWIALGGDAALTFFATCPRFFARVRSKTDGMIVADQLLIKGTPVTDAGAGRTIQMFFGGEIRNRYNPDEIIRRTYTFERRFKRTGVTQAEYVRGGIPNTCAWNFPAKGKVTCALGFVGCESDYRLGTGGEEDLEEGDHLATLGERVYNTAADVRFEQVVLTDPSRSVQEPLFGLVTESSINIDNQVTPDYAHGDPGAVDAQGGNFTVTGNVTAYFESFEALRSIRRNFDVSYTILFGTGQQYGCIIDMPLCSIAGELDVEKNTSTKLPLTLNGCMNKFGHTLLYNYFAYIPAAWVSKY